MDSSDFGLYTTMYMIRCAEKEIQKYYKENKMKTPMHMSMGEEAIVAGVVHALNDKDQFFGTYRSHALYLAKTRDLDGFFAEMYGKVSGGAKGKAGSMHLSKPENGMMMTSAIVATTIPVAVGAALANVYMNNERRVAVFFGDGAVDEGAFWESFNFSCLKRLPIIFVYQDNDLAIHSSVKQRHGYKNILDIVKQFNCYISGTENKDMRYSPEMIYKATRLQLEKQKIEMKPVFFAATYYRYLEHVGVDTDFDAGYRKAIEWDDPVDIQRKIMVKKVGKNGVVALETAINVAVEASIIRAQKASFPDKDELWKDVYV